MVTGTPWGNVRLAGNNYSLRFQVTYLNTGAGWLVPKHTAVLRVNTMKIESTTKSDQTSMSPKNVTTFQIYLRTLTIAFCLSHVVNFNVILLKFVQLIDQDPQNLVTVL